MQCNVLVDFYHLKSTKTAYLRFFRKWLVKNYPDWIEDNLGAYQARIGEDWFESKHFAGILRDQVHVQEIIDDFFESNTTTAENWRWLRRLSRYLAPQFHVRNWDGAKAIDWKEHQISFIYYDVRHEVGLQPIYQEICNELLALFNEEKMAVKKCLWCKKLIKPTPGGSIQKYCSGACRKRYDRSKGSES